VVPDQIGFGKSGKPDVEYSFETMARETAALLDSLKIQHVFVVGHSMGGMLAVKFARMYPERVDKLVLEDPIGLEDYRQHIPAVPLEKLFADELAKTDAAQTRAFYKHYFVEWKPEYEKFVEFQARQALSGEWPRAAKASALSYKMIFEQPVRQEFRYIQVPTLLIIGSADRTVVGKNYAPPEATKDMGNYPELGKAAAKDIPGGKLVEIPNVGHIPHLEAPAAFQASLLAFLRN
jgi:pimeloyl-ACP methyl ester carboxylesterase